MSRQRDLSERKAQLVAQSELQRMQAQLAWHDVRMVISPPRLPSTPGSRALSVASKLLAVAIPLVGVGRLRRVFRYMSLGMMAFRAFRSWRG